MHQPIQEPQDFYVIKLDVLEVKLFLQGDSNMTGTDLYVNKRHCAAAVRP